LVLNDLGQGLTRNIVHDNKGTPPFNEAVADPHNMGVLKLRKALGFLDKALPQIMDALGWLLLEVEGFQDDGLVEQGVGGAVGDPKASLT